MNIVKNGKCVYKLFDFFDKEKENPVKRNFRKTLKKGKKFSIKGVTYKVVKVSKKTNNAIIRMIKYRINNTATAVVHKCPARKSGMEAMDKGDIVELEEKIGSKIVDQWKKGRVKMQGHMKQQCPFCKVVFWKESMEIPAKVKVSAVMKKKQLISKGSK